MITLPWGAWAAVAAGGALLLWRPDPTWLARHRLGVVGSPVWPRRVALAVGLPAVPVVLGLVEAVAALIVVAVALGVAVFVTGQVRRDRRRAAARRSHERVTEVADALAAELRAGVVPMRALTAAAADLEVVDLAAQVAALGGDVPEALRTAAGQPGCQALADLAAAWHVSESCGAPLADVVDRVARGHRFESTLIDEVRAGIEPARATGRLLAVLPLFGLVLGSTMGADPVRVVTTTLPGAACLAVGVALACVGVRWIDATADRAERA